MPARRIGYYSFKGGVGRTNCALNTAYHLARKGYKVGLLDFDLEAPGLSVLDALKPAYGHTPRPDKGLVDYLDGASAFLAQETMAPPPSVTQIFYQTKLAMDSLGAVLLAPAAGYAGEPQRTRNVGEIYHRLVRMHTFNNTRVPGSIGADVLRYLVDVVEKHEFVIDRGPKGDVKETIHLDFLLSDLRTGLTGLADEAIGVLFDELVIVCGLNEQNVQGMLCALDTFHKKAKPRERWPIDVKVVFSPVPVGEYGLVEDRLWSAYGRLLEKNDWLVEQGSRLCLNLPQLASVRRRQGYLPDIPLIHYADYLGAGEEVVLARYPDSTVARELRDIVDAMLKTREDVQQESQEKLAEAGIKTSSPERLDPTETFTLPRPEPRAWRDYAGAFAWLRTVLRKPPHWAWPLTPPFTTNDDQADSFKREFQARVNPSELADPFFDALSVSISADTDGSRESILADLKLRRLWGDQIEQLLETFEKERMQLLALRGEEERIADEIVQALFNWIEALRREGAPLRKQDELFDAILNEKPANDAPVPWPVLSLAWIRRAATPDTVVKVFASVKANTNSMPELGLLFLLRINMAQFAALPDGASWLEAWTAALGPESFSVNGFLKAAEQATEQCARPDVAERLLVLATRRDPKASYPWFILGNLRMNQLKQYEAAEQAYREAIEHNPKDVRPWNNLGNLLQKIGRYVEAESTYRQAIACAPNEAYPWNNLGNLHKNHLGRYAEAEQAYREAIECDPKFAAPWNNLGNLLQDYLGRYTEAEQAYREAIECDPKNAAPWNGLGNLLQEHLGRYVEAEEALRRAIDIDKSTSVYGIYSLLCLAFLRSGDGRTREKVMAEAKQWVEDLERPGTTDGALLQCALLLALGHEDTAKKILGQLNTAAFTQEQQLWFAFLCPAAGLPDAPWPDCAPGAWPACEVEAFADMVALLADRVPQQVRAKAVAWLEQCLGDFSPPSGGPDINPVAIGPALQRLGVRDYVRRTAQGPGEPASAQDD